MITMISKRATYHSFAENEPLPKHDIFDVFDQYPMTAKCFVLLAGIAIFSLAGIIQLIRMF